MPLRSYGVLKATILDRRLATARTDHYQLLCGVGTTRWRVSINAHSDVPPSDVSTPAAFATTPPARSAQGGLARIAAGGGAGLRPRQALPARALPPLPLSRPARATTSTSCSTCTSRAAPACTRSASRGARTRRDPFFGFQNGRGIHDVHQNQGNIRRYQRDDGVWQDGGLLVERDGAWTAILLRFQSQSWRTDDATGHAR